MQNDNQKKDGLFLPSRQVGLLLSGLIIAFFVFFISGYFLGKKQIADELMYKIEQESFADQVYSSLCALYDQDLDSAQIEETDQLVSQDKNVLVPEKEEELIINNSIEPQTESVHLGKQYYAQLIGFGTQQAADQFAQRIGKIAQVEVRARESSTAKGRKITWYQVVTKPFNDRDSLHNAVDRITKQEKLKGVQICSS
jgi:hypothetical protein